MANPDFVDFGVEQDGTGAITVNAPGNWAANDVLVLYVATDGFTPTLSTPNGYVLAVDPQGNAASVNVALGACGMHIFWKRALGSKASGLDLQPVVAAPSGGGTVIALHTNVYNNCRTSGTPFHTIVTATVATTAAIATPNVTTTLADCTVLGVAASENDDSVFNSWGFTGSASPSGTIDSGWHSALGNACSWAGGRGGYAAAGGPHNGTSNFGATTRQAQIGFALASLAETSHFGTEAGQLAGTTPAITGVAAVVGAEARTAGGSTPSIAGTVGTPVNGTVARTLGGSTPSIAGVVTSGPTGSVGGTLAGSAPSISGSAAVAGTEARTAGGSTPSITGSVSVSGSVAGTLGGSQPSIIGVGVSPLRLGAIFPIRQKADGNVVGLPGAGTLTTLAPITAWAAATAHTIDQGVKRSRGGNVYELVQSGTTGATGPSGTGTSIQDGGGAGGCLWNFVGADPGAINTTTGSAIFAFAALGTWADTPQVPTDNFSNTFTQVGLDSYTGFPPSLNGLFVKFGATGGTNHTLSKTYGNGGGGGTPDECTVGGFEVIGATFVKTVAYLEQDPAVANTVTGPLCHASAPAIIWSDFWLDGVVRTPGTQHKCVPIIITQPLVGGNPTVTIQLVPIAVAATSLSTNGYIQHFAAVLVPIGGAFGDPVQAGDYRVGCTTDTGEGSAVRTVSIQAVDGVVASVAGTAGGSTPSISGTVTTQRTGTVAATLSATTPTISAQNLVTAAVAQALSGSTPSISGTVTSNVTGLVAGQLGGTAPSITATAAVAGLSTGSGGGSTPSISGSVVGGIVGTVGGSLGGSTPSISGTVVASPGVVAGLLGGSTPSIAGVTLVAAVATGSGRGSQPSITGAVSVRATVAGQLGSSSLFSGSLPALVVGVLNGTLGGSTPHITGVVTTRPIVPRYMTLARLLAVWSDGSEPDVESGVPTNTAKPIEWPRGSTGNVNVTLVETDGTPIDLDLVGGDDLVLSVRQGLTSDPILSRSATKADETGAYRFTIASGDTIDFQGRLIYDVWATRAGAQRQVVGASYFTASPRIRTP